MIPFLLVGASCARVREEVAGRFLARSLSDLYNGIAELLLIPFLGCQEDGS